MSDNNSESTGHDRLRQVLNVTFAIAQAGIILVGYATGGNANFDSRSADESPVVPAGYAFIIWGFIYPSCLAYAVFQARRRERSNALLRRIGFYTAAAFLAATLWVVAAQNRVYWLTVVFIILIFTPLVAALISVARHATPLTQHERWFVKLPVGIYAGWATAAVFANSASVLKSYGFGNFGLTETTWAASLVIVAGATSVLLVLASRANAWYAGTLVWAFAGIAVANAGNQSPVALAACASAAAAVLALVLARPRLHPGFAPRSSQGTKYDAVGVTK
ncbi:MAG TPA: hypothetical protein VFR78_07705 [Pyrinomonadaceae bacterium]|nr:hypothetical protein [Pyrinomonadaceae bacterium]